MDDNYVEYNPEAVLDDGSCLTSNVYGCIDENSINYDGKFFQYKSANTQAQDLSHGHITRLSRSGTGI